SSSSYFRDLVIAKGAGVVDFTGSNAGGTNFAYAHVAGSLVIDSGSVTGTDTLAVTGNITHRAGVAVTIGGISLAGTLSASTGCNPGRVIFDGASSQVIPPGPTYQSMTVRGPATFSGTTSITGKLIVESAGDLGLNQQTVTAGELVV